MNWRRIFVKDLSAADYPYLAEIAGERAFADGSGFQVDAEFFFGLALILDAIKPDIL